MKNTNKKHMFFDLEINEFSFITQLNAINILPKIGFRFGPLIIDVKNPQYFFDFEIK